MNHTSVPRSTDKTGWKKRNKDVAGLWMDFTDDQKTIFKDPYFWALAGLPDPDGWVVDDDDDWEDEEDDPPAQALAENVAEDENPTEDDTPDQVIKASAVIPAPHVHRLSDEDERRLRPIFDELVDKARIEINYGKPARVPSMGNTVMKGLAAFKQAHANVSLLYVCIFTIDSLLMHIYLLSSTIALTYCVSIQYWLLSLSG